MRNAISLEERVIVTLRFLAGAQPEFFLAGGGADPEAIYNLCLILKYKNHVVSTT
jgi:hypothetical protein